MELISREVVLDTIPKVIRTQSRVGKTLFAEFIKEWISNIESIPTIESRTKGKWIDNGQVRKIGGYSADCSVCGEWSEYLTNFCGNCGADMRGEE